MSITINNMKYHTTKDLTILFDVTNETIATWRNSKGLKYTRISPKKFIYSEQDLEDFMKGRK